MADNWMAQVNSRMEWTGNTQAQCWALTNCCWWMTITCCLLRCAPLNFCCSYYRPTNCVCPLKQANTYFIHRSYRRPTDSCTQNYTIYTAQCTAQCHRTKQVMVVCHSTDMCAHDSNDCYCLPVLLLRVWDWWILNDIEIALCSAHFWYRDSIEYRDTRDGIVIVAPISGITQH